MKTKIWKMYYDYEKEEKWLNEMSAKGFALTDYTWCRYTFADCEPGEYTYRLELLEYLPSHSVSQKYIRFMEESGAEHVASYMRWVYFRKKTCEGSFDIHTDADSKIKHYQRINLLFTVIACGNLLAGVSNFGIWSTVRSYGSFPTVNFVAGTVSTLIGIFLLYIGHPARKKIKKLKADKLIM